MYLILVHPSHHQVVESIARLVVACDCFLLDVSNRMILSKEEDSGTPVCEEHMLLHT